MLSELPENVYYEVFENRNEYNANVRWALHEPEIPPRFVRNPVRDMSDEEWNDKLNEVRSDMLLRLKKHKETFQPPPRPLWKIDGYILEAKSELEDCKKALEDASKIARRTQGYVPPGMRRNDTPAVAKARANVTKAENELKRLQAELETEIIIWNDQACRDAF
jgi:hypothetical protein